MVTIKEWQMSIGKQITERLRRLADGDRTVLETGTENVLYPMREALKCMATVGEVCGVLRAVWGEYRPAVRL
jgi:methylmalonyl-CoA mutase N-terminal domain/subunit